MASDNGHNLYTDDAVAANLKAAQLAAGADAIVSQAMNLDLIDLQRRKVVTSEKMQATAQARAVTDAETLTWMKSQPAPLNLAKVQLTDLRKFALDQAVKSTLPRVTSILAIDPVAVTALADKYFLWLKTDI